MMKTFSLCKSPPELALTICTTLILIALTGAFLPGTASAAGCQKGYTYSKPDKRCIKNSPNPKPKTNPKPKNGDAGGGSGGGSTSVNVDSSQYNTGLPNTPASQGQLKEILQIAFAVIGGIAVLFVAIGGLRYVLAGDNPQDQAQARDTVIYAVIGALIALLAEVIIAFVLDKL